MGRMRFLPAGILLAQAWLWAAVRHAKVPENGISPDVVEGRTGEVYLVYTRDRDAWFAVSGDAGTLPANSKATGFVDRHRDFCLVF